MPSENLQTSAKITHFRFTRAKKKIKSNRLSSKQVDQPMKFKILALVLAALAANSANASERPASRAAVDAGWTTFNATDKYGSNESLQGLRIGVSSSLDHPWGVFGNLQFQSGEYGIRYNEFSAGFQAKIFDKNGFYSLGKAAVGLGSGKADGLDSRVQFLALTPSVEVGYRAKNNLGLYVGVGYKWLSENNSRGGGAVCRDGTTSSSTGQGTCSYHGGVDYYREAGEKQIGSVSGLVMSTGLRYAF